MEESSDREPGGITHPYCSHVCRVCKREYIVTDGCYIPAGWLVMRVGPAGWLRQPMDVGDEGLVDVVLCDQHIHSGPFTEIEIWAHPEMLGPWRLRDNGVMVRV